ncbi:sugar ABC transporter permease [Sulfitobacter sp. HNIBRBA2951]|uniref:carbohydrate ABC transporter permease n=1 Tax=Sulfitobacter aquimarinus TaxID=3158557 RepID=UPI0032DE9082
MKQQRNAAWWQVLPAVALLGLVGFIPLVAVFNYSFFDIFTLDSRFWVGTEWYAALVGTPDLYAALGRSLLFTTLVLMIQLPLGVGIALLIPQNTFAKGTILMILALPLVVPWNMIPIIWLGFINTNYGLLGQMLEAMGWNFDYKFTALHTWILIVAMDTWHWVGLVAILANSGLSMVPQTYYLAAKIDGAGSWAVFRYIQLPKLQGVLTMALILRVTDSMMIYTEAFGINAGGPDNATSFLSLELGEDIAAFDYGPAAARSVVYFLIVLLVAWVLQVSSRRHIRGPL